MQKAVAVWAAAFATVAAGCASMRGEAQYKGTGISVTHNHRGGVEGEMSIRQIWVHNGTDRAILVDIDCPYTDWHSFRIGAHMSQGWEEWSGECRAFVLKSR